MREESNRAPMKIIVGAKKEDQMRPRRGYDQSRFDYQRDKKNPQELILLLSPKEDEDKNHDRGGISYIVND